MATGIPLTDDEDRTKRIAKEAAHEAISEAFERLGVDPAHDWQQAQQDFGFLRRMRQGSEAVVRFIMRSAIATAVSGIAWAVWQAAKGGK